MSVDSLMERGISRRERIEVLATWYRRLAEHEKSVERTSEARRKLPAGSTRARVTTANARWATACEARDRQEAAIRELRAADGSLP